MCSRYSLTSPHEAVRATFATMGGFEFPPRWNIAPSQPVVIVRHGHKGEREMTAVRWGLIPGWVKDPAAFRMIINARSETVLEKPSFRAALKYRRCLVPADGFYEWQGPPKDKRPTLFRSRANAPFAFAGLWEHWLGADGSEMESVAIVTTTPNAVVSTVHDRMPVILDEADHETWLDVRGQELEAVIPLMRPAPDDLLTATAVTKAVNSSKVEGPELQLPYSSGLLL
jgi:putative SOS response-associated peptidase YedK